MYLTIYALKYALTYVPAFIRTGLHNQVSE